jgi:hypothetical protein
MEYKSNFNYRYNNLVQKRLIEFNSHLLTTLWIGYKGQEPHKKCSGVISDEFHKKEKWRAVGLSVKRFMHV